MPEIQELIDVLTEQLEDIEDRLNGTEKEEGFLDANIAVIDQKWAMLRAILVNRSAGETT